MFLGDGILTGNHDEHEDFFFFFLISFFFKKKSYEGKRDLCPFPTRHRDVLQQHIFGDQKAELGALSFQSL